MLYTENLALQEKLEAALSRPRLAVPPVPRSWL